MHRAWIHILLGEQQNIVNSMHATFLERGFLVKGRSKSMQVELDLCPKDEPNKEEILKTVGEP